MGGQYAKVHGTQDNDMGSHPASMKEEWHQRLSPSRAGQMSFALAIGAPPAAAAVLVPLRAHIADAALALIMVAVVVMVVVPGRRLAALLAGISAGLWFDFFLTRPYESFTMNRSADIQTTVLLLLVAVGVGELAARERRHRAESEIGTENLDVVAEVTELLAEGVVAEEVLGVVTDALVPLLHLVSCRFEADATTVAVPYIARPGFVSYTAYRWDATTKGLPVGLVALPVRSQDRLVGQFRLEGPFPGVPVLAQELAAAVVLADLAGVALARPDRSPAASATRR
jgi:K+-sensing histidine kinase KdpD